MILSASLARILFGSADPIGRIIRLRGVEHAVIGVAADVDNTGVPSVATILKTQ